MSVWRLPMCQARRTKSSDALAVPSIRFSVLSVQRQRLLKTEQKPRAPLAGQHNAPPLAVIRIEHDAVGGRTECASGFDIDDADHFKICTPSWPGHSPSKTVVNALMAPRRRA